MRFSMLFAVCVVVSGCTRLPSSAYETFSGPESLLDQSKERVTVALAASGSAESLIEWLDQDQPSRVELHCDQGESNCTRAARIAEQFAVPYEFVDSGAGKAVLVYERVVARDCDPRFVSDHINPYNLHHRGYGCSVSANALQMISDRRQITAPSLMDPHDGQRVQDTMSIYRTVGDPAELSKFEDVFEFRGGQ
jgi:type IV pilus biogenesis protein CpaD/CtpE